MKRIFRIIIILISLIIIISMTFICSSQTKRQSIEVYPLRSITEIYENEEKYILFLQENCLSCKIIKDAIKQNDLRLPDKIYTLDLKSSEKKDLIDIIVKKYDIQVTPTLLFIKNSEKFSKIDLEPILSDNKNK